MRFPLQSYIKDVWSLFSIFSTLNSGADAIYALATPRPIPRPAKPAIITRSKQSLQTETPIETRKKGLLSLTQMLCFSSSSSSSDFLSFSVRFFLSLLDSSFLISIIGNTGSTATVSLECTSSSSSTGFKGSTAGFEGSTTGFEGSTTGFKGRATGLLCSAFAISRTGSSCGIRRMLFLFVLLSPESDAFVSSALFLVSALAFGFPTPAKAFFAKLLIFLKNRTNAASTDMQSALNIFFLCFSLLRGSLCSSVSAESDSLSFAAVFSFLPNNFAKNPLIRNFIAAKFSAEKKCFIFAAIIAKNAPIAPNIFLIALLSDNLRAVFAKKRFAAEKNAFTFTAAIAKNDRTAPIIFFVV